MTDVNLYFFIEDLGLTAAQRNTLVNQLKALGQRNLDLQPKNRNHWAIRSDNKAIIFEAWWDDAILTAVAIRNRLASIFGVSNTSITYATTNTVYGPYVDYSYQSTPRLRFGVFGGVAATYEQSHDAASAYLETSPEWNTA